MSVLIDNLIITLEYADNRFSNGLWYIAKPFDTPSFKHRLKDAYKVLIGKSFAYHFKEDEKDEEVQLEKV